MNELVEKSTQVQGIDLTDVLNNPSNYPDELIAASLDKIKQISGIWYENKLRLEGYLIGVMQKENATKTVFIDSEGKEKVITLKKGSMSADKDADEKYRHGGFDPIEIGEYVFKASWSKAKEARKFGGDKQIIIDDLFKEGKASLTITEK